MEASRALEWSYQNLDFRGYSIAGQTTSMYFHTPKICFDIAQGFHFHLSAKLFCLTHLHADHGAGLNYLLSQRSLFSLPQAKIMLPKANVESVEIILKEWMKIEGFQYSYELIPVEHHTTFDFSDQYLVRSFATTHRVPSFGYLVYGKRKKLKAEFTQLERKELLDLKSRGVSLEEELLEPLVAFTGDTQIEFLDSHPDVLKAKILFMECTYLDNKKNVAAAREWGHIHFQEILQNLHRFQNEHISLIHLSARHSTTEAQEILKSHLPLDWQNRISIFPRPL